MNRLRLKIAYALIRLACKFSDTPLRSIYVMNKRTVGDKLRAYNDTVEPRIKLSRRKLAHIHSAYLKQQAALKRLYSKDTANGQE